MTIQAQEIAVKTNGYSYQPSGFELALFNNDISKLTSEDRVTYCLKLCESLGLNHLSKPFQYISLNGKLTLYATKDCTEQLRKINGVSINIIGREKGDGIYVVTARATDKVGRIDEASGAVNIQGLKGDALANALMKAETKAKRRVTLSICGLGILDESELETIPNVVRVDATPLIPTLPHSPTPAVSYDGNPWEHRIEAECTNKGKCLHAIPKDWLERAVSPKHRSKLSEKDYSAIVLALESPEMRDEALADASIYDIEIVEE